MYKTNTQNKGILELGKSRQLTAGNTSESCIVVFITTPNCDFIRFNARNCLNVDFKKGVKCGDHVDDAILPLELIGFASHPRLTSPM